MANTFGASPPIWILDTPSATPVSLEWIRIYRIRWVAGGSSVEGDECLIEDQNGKVIFDEFSTGADYETIDMTLDAHKGKSINGLTLPTLANGKVYIYLA